MVGETEETSHGLGDESEKRMEEEIICNRWKDLADESILHRRSFLAFGNSGYMISSIGRLMFLLLTVGRETGRQASQLIMKHKNPADQPSAH